MAEARGAGRQTDRRTDTALGEAAALPARRATEAEEEGEGCGELLLTVCSAEVGGVLYSGGGGGTLQSADVAVFNRLRWGQRAQRQIPLALGARGG